MGNGKKVVGMGKGGWVGDGGGVGLDDGVGGKMVG